ncbi:MAG: hypothetical protein PHX27_02630 [Candidatus ainarchaeum sp.]|nr:hypothetical protein [Candidatus ainarchaeum sp.]
MAINIFLKPTNTLKDSLENPSLILSLIIVIISAIPLSILIFLGSNNFFITGILLLSFIINWLVLSIVFWTFSFMFIPKKTKVQSNFIGILTATSKLWLFLFLIGVFTLFSLLGNIFTVIAGIMIFILSILLIIDSFILMKIIIDTNNTKVFLLWILAVILYTLINSIAFGITTLLIL